MTGDWTAAAVVASFAACALAAACVALLVRTQRLVLRRQQSLEEQIGMLDEAVQMIEARLAELHPAWNAEPAPGSDATSGADAGDMAAEEAPESVIDPVTQAVIAAAAFAVAGPNAQVRSATLLKPREKASAWSQQGRVLVHTSHNLRS